MSSALWSIWHLWGHRIYSLGGITVSSPRVASWLSATWYSSPDYQVSSLIFHHLHRGNLTFHHIFQSLIFFYFFISIRLYSKNITILTIFNLCFWFLDCTYMYHKNLTIPIFSIFISKFWFSYVVTIKQFPHFSIFLFKLWFACTVKILKFSHIVGIRCKSAGIL